MRSIWSLTSDIEDRSERKLPEIADIVVIGGGMAGILTAFILQQRGMHPVVLEAEGIGSGQTRNTTAKITVQHGLFYHKAIVELGREKTQAYVRANMEALDYYRRLVREKHISCDWQEGAACLYTRRDIEILEREQEAATELGIESRITRKTELPFAVSGALEFGGQAAFHPLRFLETVAGEVPVCENCKVFKVEGNMVCTNRGEVYAKNIVFATHYPFINVPGFYFMKMHQERSYCIAITGARSIKNMYYGIDEEALSLRSYGKYLLLGGYGHRTGERTPGEPYRKLREDAAHYFPGCEVQAQWSAQDCITLDHIPYIGKYSHARPGWYIASGFGKWGMTGAMTAAMIVSDLITQGKSPYEEVFSPQRFAIKASLPNLWKEGVHSVKGLSRNLFGKAQTVLEQLQPGTGGTVKWSGKIYGAYKDEKGKCYLVPLSCPHLGCRLEWNSAEKSWDCPCHGSRFHYDGTLIDNPAQTGLESAKTVNSEP